MPVMLLRGKDSYRRQLFWTKMKKEGYERIAFSGDSAMLTNVLTTPHLFGKALYYIDDQRLISDITDYLIYHAIHHLLVIDQRERSDACYRRLARKFEVVPCDAILSYKTDDLIAWIYSIAGELGVAITYEESRLLLDNLGEESIEIVRVLELSKLSGVPVGKLVEYDTSKAMLEVIDFMARHKYDRAVKSLIFLQQQGVEFMQVSAALLTRYELLLKIKSCRMLRLPDADIIMRLRLSRMIAGNVLSEANMNSFKWIIQFMKNLVVNAMSPVGYDWLILTLLNL